MKLIKSKKGFALLAAIAVVAIAAVGGYAYWTTTGAGSGSVANASSNGTVVLHATWPTNALYPGGSQTVSFTADNAGTSNLFVGTVTSVVTTNDPLCLPADFTVAPVAENQVIPAGASGLALTNTGTISFANTAANQDACKGATVTLTLSS
jgi:hypothetical protein